MEPMLIARLNFITLATRVKVKSYIIRKCRVSPISLPTAFPSQSLTGSVALSGLLTTLNLGQKAKM
jgi:hypothetical protein